MMLHLLLGS